MRLRVLPRRPHRWRVSDVALGVRGLTECRAAERALGPHHRPVAYDEDLADRIRELTVGEVAVREQRMFGGLAFLVDGNLAVSASGQGGLLVRVDPAECDRLVESTGAEVAVMGERRMHGWLHLTPEHLRSPRELGIWVRRGVDYARSLPAKRPGERRRG